MTITTTKLYKLLSSQMNEETAETLTNFIEEKVKEDIDSLTGIFLTKEDKIDMIDRMNKIEKISSPGSMPISLSGGHY